MNKQSELPSSEDYIPQWTSRRIVVVDKSERWSPAISAEVWSRSLKQNVRFEACDSTRDAQLYLEMKNTVGLILFLNGVERESCSLLGKLFRLPSLLPVMLVAEDRHRAIVPVLLEAGAMGVLFNVRDDIPIAEWCCRILQTFE